MDKILVAGSLNIDLVTQVPYLPKPGETLTSLAFYRNPGGKGANQASIIGKLTGRVGMIGKVGDDDHGELLLETLRNAHVDTSGIQVAAQDDTGMAFIQVSNDGENSIVLVPGTNSRLYPADIVSMEELLHESDIVLLQLEIPLETAAYVIDRASSLNKKIILNPAPAVHLDTALLEKIDILVPNESELSILSGLPADTDEGVRNAARDLLAKGVKSIVVTMGERGSWYFSGEEEQHVPTLPAEVVDTTGAGDAYIGALAYGLSKGYDEISAMKAASRVASIAVSQKGAQPELGEDFVFAGGM
ncbi:MAG: ribokinase [Spirochaetaceae bacterium]